MLIADIEAMRVRVAAGPVAPEILMELADLLVSKEPAPYLKLDYVHLGRGSCATDIERLKSSGEYSRAGIDLSPILIDHILASGSIELKDYLPNSGRAAPQVRVGGCDWHPPIAIVKLSIAGRTQI